jgi:hypothetical protein
MNKFGSQLFALSHSVCVVSFILLNADVSMARADSGRQTIWEVFLPTADSSSGSLNSEEVSESSASPFSIGSLLGVTLYLTRPAVYRVDQERRVVRDDRGDILGPCALLLPSVAIAKIGGVPLSVIVPAGLSGLKVSDIAIGFGLSAGLNVGRRADVGLAVSLVWIGVPSLNAGQQISFDSRNALAAGESTSIGESRRVSVVLGVYIAPHL